MGQYAAPCFIGLLLIMVGYLIWFKEKHFLISGHRFRRRHRPDIDEHKLARQIGMVNICLGVIFVTGPLFFMWTGPILGTILTLFALAITFGNLRKVKE